MTGPFQAIRVYVCPGNVNNLLAESKPAFLGLHAKMSPKSHLDFELQVNFNDPWSWVKTEARVLPQRTVYVDFTKRFCAFCIKMSLVFREFTLWQIMKPPSARATLWKDWGLLWAPTTARWRQIWHPKSNNVFHLNIQEMLNFFIHLFLIKNPCLAKKHVSETYLDYKNCSSY